MKKIIIFLVFLYVITIASAQKVYKIYDGIAPGSESWTNPEMTLPSPSGRPLIYNVSEPTITVYKSDPAIDTKAAMIIAPGGANIYLTWEEEGINVAQWLQRNGITGIILKYRTYQTGETAEEVQKSSRSMLLKILGSIDRNQRGTNQPANAPSLSAPVQATPNTPTPTLQGDDGRQAIKYVRRHAEELGIDPQKIGIVGFSAGGFLTMNVVMINDTESRPNFAAPIYGVENVSSLPENPMPLFICAPEFDLGSPVDPQSIYNIWQAARIPAELHFIYDASHGEGLLYNGRQWNQWIDMMYSFMKAVKFIN